MVNFCCFRRDQSTPGKQDIVLTALEVDDTLKLHEAALEILGRTGVHLPHPEALDLFCDAGAEVDRAAQHVKIPADLVHHSLAVCGKEFTLYGRDPSKRARFGAGERNYNMSAGQALWVDDGVGKRRYASLDDVRTAARLGDALPGITIVGPMADPQELDPRYRCVQVAAEVLKNTTKPITFWFHDRPSARFVMDLFSIVAGSREAAMERPFGYPLLEPISPLRFPHVGVDLLFETCPFGLPVVIGPMAQSGASAPVTLAGTLAQQNAEILAGLCLVQLIRPGLPVCYGGIPHAFDMRVAQTIFGGPEQALMAIAMTQMGKHYGLPVYVNTGLTDSKCADGQAGLEIGVTLASGALAGADVFGHLGICGMDQGASVSMLILQHEAIGYVERMVRGIEVDPEHLGLDVVHEVGCGGSFLTQAHTAMHFREELYVPQIFSREGFEHWRSAGQPRTEDHCRSEKDRYLDQSDPEPLPEDTQKDIAALLDAAQRHLTS